MQSNKIRNTIATSANCNASAFEKIHYLEGLRAINLFKLGHGQTNYTLARHLQRQVIALNIALEFYTCLHDKGILDLYQCFIPAKLHQKKQQAQTTKPSQTLVLVINLLDQWRQARPCQVSAALLRDANLISINNYESYFNFFFHLTNGQKELFTIPKSAKNEGRGMRSLAPIANFLN
jgi:hypothetical protein